MNIIVCCYSIGMLELNYGTSIMFIVVFALRINQWVLLSIAGIWLLLLLLVKIGDRQMPAINKNVTYY